RELAGKVMRAAGKTDRSRTADDTTGCMGHVGIQVESSPGRCINRAAVDPAGVHVQRPGCYVDSSGVIESNTVEVSCSTALVQGAAVVEGMGGSRALRKISVAGYIEHTIGQVVDDARHRRAIAEVQPGAAVG